MIKAVIFDCFGVLTVDNWLAFIDSLPEGIDVEKARQIHRSYDSGFITKEESKKQIHELTGRTFVEIDDMLQGEIAKNTGLLDYIRELRRRGISIGMLSNIASNWVRDTFLTTEEQELFDAMVFSYEVGMIKPDPRMFMLICERLRVGPHEAVLVDDKERYCEAAKTEGLQAIMYEDLTQLKTGLELILSLE